MKRLSVYIIILLSVSLVQASFAQQYRNEWIDFSKTYYKFKVGTEGIYRISKTVLDAVGAPQANGTQYAMYLNGAEVPLYVSTNGAFGANDYIEFFGEPGNGKPDTELFADPSWQADVRKSLFTDTAAYFLTINNATANLRYANVPNVISNPSAPLSYCWASSEVHYDAFHSPGKHYGTGYPIFYSEFNNGEGFMDAYRFTNQSFSLSLTTPNFSTQQNANLQLALLRNTYNPNTENVKVFFNNQQVADSSIAPDVTKHFNLSVSPALLTANNTIQVTGTVSGNSSYDIMGCSYLYIRYPRNMDVSGLNYFNFELAASATAQYVELQSFNHGGTAPKLYDLTNRQWYSGDIAVSGVTRFQLQPSFIERKFILIASNSNRIYPVQSSKTIQFTDYTAAANRGDYVIVSHRNYAAVTNGRNYVQDYSDYRSSMTGGGRNCLIAYVDDLYDQFAYGIETHPLAVRNFMRYAYDKWTTKPHDLFLIGKGVSYNHNKAYLGNKAAYAFSGSVPTFGYPGSDVDLVNFLPNKLMAMNVGRISAWSPLEVGQYLDKVKAYEAALRTPVSPDYEKERWKKLVIHAAGGSSVEESTKFLNTLTNKGAVIIKDTSYGAVIYNVAKTSTNPIDENLNSAVDSLVNNGVSLITYHGHAASSTFELSTFNNPEKYINTPRLPHFLGLGCDVAYIFSLSSVKTIGERYVGLQAGGAITMIAADNFQYTDFHSNYLPGIYGSISKINYGKAIGDHHRYSYNTLWGNSQTESNFMHLESMILQGDPAIPVFGLDKPDYHVAASRVSAVPTNVTTDMDSFTLKIVVYNLAKAISDTVNVKIEHINPANTVTTLPSQKVVNLYNSDTVSVRIPINKIADLGLNKYRVTIDDVNKFDETSETNNTATLDIFIYSDNVTPVYPWEFSIVNRQGITLKASTLNPFRPAGRYKLEIDTTELFNSNIKQETTITGIGGVIKWTPTLSYRDSTVYYWRASIDSLINGEYRWTGSSFIYLANGSPGWNQSHYYQYRKDGFDRLTYGNDRVFRYFSGNTELTVYNAIYSQFQQTTPWDGSAYCAIAINGVDIQQIGCPPWGGTIQIVVIDSSGAEVWRNAGGQSGSYDTCYMVVNNRQVFEFGVNTLSGRNKAKHFLDSIPDNHYVLIKNMINDLGYDTALADEWKTDENVNGIGNSLYHTIHNMGFTLIDSFTKPRPFVFFRMKGNSSYPVTQVVRDSADTIQRVFLLPTRITKGNLNGTVIGPAKEWKTLKWKTSALDNRPQNDYSSVTITGIDTINARTVLYTGRARDTSLSFIDAHTYPLLQLQWHSLDSIDRSSAQLDFWRILYSPVPEAALNPASYYAFSDSVQVGQMMRFATAVENLTELPMDSMLVRYKVIDANNTTHTIASKRYRPLPGNDTLIASIEFDPSVYPGNNVFFIEANPDNDQPEQYHPNNLGYIPFKIDVDNKNPLIDVTFDGVHILDRDIVSAKPFIKIALKDENKYLKLDDTSLLTLNIRNPNDLNARAVPFDGTVSKFIPAQGNKNEAYIEYKPTFAEDGIYELVVNGKDKSGNAAGGNAYKISFEVVNKATITHVLNYPNPFSTSTAFVFTLTGSQVPTQFKIQILTVTGKVVREITRQELGNIHIGRNITDYKWDGKDQYGQTLGNGVYFYRIVTSLNGSDIEHRGNGTDKFFKNGYGKMYIMR